ncbi:MAG: hypothetical protein K2J87_04770 [Muribaculaceae bacterium]|nr:hypothetical protein [Muribaculaceae bacterium]
MGLSAFSPLTNATYAKQTFTLSSDNTVGAGKKLNKSFFMQESLSDRANDGAFTIGLKVRHAHKIEGNGQNEVSDYEQHNITRDILSYINRNDWIVIPVRISRYDVNVEALFYPPIGGYPAMTSSTDPEGAQIFTFGTPGDFEIAATVTDKQAGMHLAPIYYTIAISNVTGTDIFSKQPTLTSTSASLPNEVTGTLNEKEGKASLEFTVKVYDRPHYEAGAVNTDSYTRKIYIIRN